MQSDSYKENLKYALINLNNVNQSIFDSIVSVSMQGELKEWNDAVHVGESHQFSFEMFKNSDDSNIKMLVQLIENIDATFETIKNINCIEFDEKIDDL